MSDRPQKKRREEITAAYHYDSGEGSSAAVVDKDEGDSSDEEDMDMADLPVEGGSLDQQIEAILDGSSDAQICEILCQLPALNNGEKFIIGMRKLSPEASAFTLLQPVAEQCTNDRLLVVYRKIGGLTQQQLDKDIPDVFEDDPETAAALMTHPPEMRRRAFFMSLAAGYL